MEQNMAATDVVTQDLAQRVGVQMLANDHASKALGIELVSVGLGSSCIQMTVRQDMLNGHGTCHGGFLFTLADSAFAFACNSSNEVTVAASASIEFLAPARSGDRLVARAAERWRSGRNGVYDIEIRREDNAVIALFRGKSFQIGGAVVANEVAIIVDVAGTPQ